ncbi:MAG TPA: hypothetical protein VFK36_08755 [Gemmatimonadales bacterium]|nr:hypothetical protein [Gemmatimonadales bacterium]
MSSVKIRTRKLRKPPRPHPHVRFLRRLRAGGRSNMYGAIPYLMDAFGLDRAQAFQAICDFLDAEAGIRASPLSDTSSG